MLSSLSMPIRVFSWRTWGCLGLTALGSTSESLPLSLSWIAVEWTNIWLQISSSVLSVTCPLSCLCLKTTILTGRNTFKVLSPQGSRKGYLGGDTPPILMLFKNNLITTITHKGLICLSTLNNSSFFPPNDFQKPLLNTTTHFSAQQVF